jgi:hypothetical protein
MNTKLTRSQIFSLLSWKLQKVYLFKCQWEICYWLWLHHTQKQRGISNYNCTLIPDDKILFFTYFYLVINDDARALVNYIKDKVIGNDST